MTDRKADFLAQKIALITYLASKLKSGDWHAVQDAASDIRELDARLALLREQAEELEKPTLAEHVHVWRYNISDDSLHCVCGEKEFTGGTLDDVTVTMDTKS